MSENNPAWEIRYTAFSRDVLLFSQHTSFLCHPWQAKFLTPTAEQVKTYKKTYTLAGSLSNAALTVQAQLCTEYPTTHPTDGQPQGIGRLKWKVHSVTLL